MQNTDIHTPRDIYIHTHIHTYIHAYIHTYRHFHTCTHTYRHINTNTNTYIYVNFFYGSNNKPFSGHLRAKIFGTFLEKCVKSCLNFFLDVFLSFFLDKYKMRRNVKLLPNRTILLQHSWRKNIIFIASTHFSIFLEEMRRIALKILLYTHFAHNLHTFFVRNLLPPQKKNGHIHIHTYIYT